MTTEIESATPADAQAEQVHEPVENQSTEATTEQPAEVVETPEEKAKKEPWFQKRIGELTREKYEAKRQADTAAQEVQQVRDQLARLQQGDTTQQPVGDVQTLVKQEAQRMVAEQTFNETCNKVYAAGKAEFPDFDQAVANLQMVGVSRDFIELATTSDAGAKLLHHLGTDLDEAARIAALSPVQMARELTKLEFKLGQKTVKPVSNAPAPISPIAGTKGGSKDPAEMTDAEFANWRRSQIAKRS
jgi:hypothetical protein